MIEIPIEQHRLANGLRVILSRDPAAAVVAVNLWYAVGSRNERAGRTGFAHLFEHMMFQGSEHVPESAHFALVEQAGGSLNGSTWLDRTNYFETLPSNYLELALWLESDRLGWLLPALTQQKLDNQRDVVKNERRWRVDNQPYGDWDERLQAMMYPAEHPYHHSIIGSMEDLDAASVEDVEEFFRTYYAPNNAVLTIAGEFEPADALRLVERYFGPIPQGPPVPPIPGRTVVPPTLGGEVRARVPQDVSLARLYVSHRVPPYGDEGWYAAEVTAHILGAGQGSLLARRLVRGRRLAQDAVAFTLPVVVGASLLTLWVTARPDVEPERLEAALFEEVDRLRHVEADDVARAISLIEARHVIDLQKMDDRADLLSQFTTLFDDPARLNTELERLRQVTPADVRRFAAERLRADNRAVLWYVPQDAAGEAGPPPAASGGAGAAARGGRGEGARHE